MDKYVLNIYRSGHWRCFIIIDVLKHFAKFTGKHFLFNCLGFICDIYMWYSLTLVKIQVTLSSAKTREMYYSLIDLFFFNFLK